MWQKNKQTNKQQYPVINKIIMSRYRSDHSVRLIVMKGNEVTELLNLLVILIIAIFI